MREFVLGMFAGAAMLSGMVALYLIALANVRWHRSDLATILCVWRLSIGYLHGRVGRRWFVEWEPPCGG